MATFMLNVDTVLTVFDRNDDDTGFVLITTAVPGIRHYRISRERRDIATLIDYFDFYLDFTGLTRDTDIIKTFPYIPELFSEFPIPINLSEIGNVTLGIKFIKEKFKLLHITPTVFGDPSRETPSYINTMASYTASSILYPIRYIYWILVNGQPRYASPHGNIAFEDQYDHNIAIDPNKRLEVKHINGIDYHIIRISTTPGLVIGSGFEHYEDTPSDTYNDGIYSYKLNAIPRGTQTWLSENGPRYNGFHVLLTILDSTNSDFPPSNPSFYTSSKQYIHNTSVTKIEPTIFKFLIRPKLGVSKLDLRITITGHLNNKLETT
jgi:hypothetical protein